jgi:hypothetical protein
MISSSSFELVACCAEATPEASARTHPIIKRRLCFVGCSLNMTPPEVLECVDTDGRWFLDVSAPL